MAGQLILAGTTFFVIFIMFLVISRTMNNIINQLVKLEYLVQKEYDLKKEAIEVKRIMEDQARDQQARHKASEEFGTK